MCGWTRTQGTIRRIGFTALLAAAAVLAFAGSANATPLAYTFSGGNQGWQQSQDNGATFSPAGFSPSGGNPGGRLTTKDTGGESGCRGGTGPCNLLYLYSPFVSPMAANYGGTGSFDLRSPDVSPMFGAELLLLPPGSAYLDGLIPEVSGTTYHHLSIPLTETARNGLDPAWAICPYLGGSCTPPTQQQFKTLISASDMVAVMVDVGPDRTGETYDLDNVTITDAPTPAPTPTPPPARQPRRKCKKHKKKHRAATAKKKGKHGKKCKKKHKKKHKKRAAALALRG